MPTFKHSGDLEDILFSLPALRALGGGVLYLDITGGVGEPLVLKSCPRGRTRFDAAQFEMIRPLLLRQAYISDVRVWRGEAVERNLDSFRPLVADGAANPAVLHLRAFGLADSLADATWIEIAESPIKLPRPQVIHRSARYHSRSMHWATAAPQLAATAIFLGGAVEHDIFQYTFGQTIPLHTPRDMLEAACIIKGAELFSGNQSWAAALAVAMGTFHYLEPFDYGPKWSFSGRRRGVFSHEHIRNAREPMVPDLNVALKSPVVGRTFKHSGDLGDIIYSLPAIKAIGGGVLYLDVSGGASDPLVLEATLGKANKFNRAGYEFLRPLLLEQPYLRDVRVWQGEEVDHNLNAVRQFMDTKRNIAGDYLRLFGLDERILDQSWLTLKSEPMSLHKPIIINRSPRVHSKDHIWERDLPKFVYDAVFIGHAKEHEIFQYTFDCRLDRYVARDALEIARILAGSRELVANQSVVMSLAIGLGTRFHQEVSDECPNCLFKRPNSDYF